MKSLTWSDQQTYVPEHEQTLRGLSQLMMTYHPIQHPSAQQGDIVQRIEARWLAALQSANPQIVADQNLTDELEVIVPDESEIVEEILQELLDADR